MMRKNQNIHHVVKITFTKRKDSLTGLLLKESERFVLLKHIPIDFQLDGYAIIDKKKIKNIEITEKELFTLDVLKSKLTLKELKGKPMKIDFNTPAEIFEIFHKKKSLIQVENERNDVAFIGIVSDFIDNTLTLKLINPRGKWGENKKIKMDGIWCVFFSNDYVKSLASFIDK